MQKDSYLYGEDVEVPEIPSEIVMRRVELLKDHLAEKLEHSYHTRTSEDSIQINKILKAIDFWEHINREEI